MHIFFNDGFDNLSRACFQNPLLSCCISQLDEAMFLNKKCCVPATDVLVTHGLNRNSTDDQTATAATRIRYLFTGIQYLLLSDTLRQSIAESPDPSKQRMEETCRVALLLFSLSILNERPPHMDYGLQLASNLCCVLEGEDCEYANSASLPARLDLQMWAIISAASVIGADEPPTQKSKCGTSNSKLRQIFFKTLRKYRGIGHYSLSSLQARLSRYPWVPGTYDDILEHLHDSE